MKRTSEEERQIQVRFSFKKINYYRIKRETGEEKGEVRGEMSLHLFKSWFKLMNNTGRLLYGVLQFVESGEMWIWQPRVKTSRGLMGGWQKAFDANRPNYDPERDGLEVHVTFWDRLEKNVTAGNISG